MRWLILLLLLFISILLESTITTIPLVFIVLLCGVVVFKEAGILILAFICGVILDFLLFHAVGSTSIYFLITLTLAFLYEQKFEIRSIPFVAVFSFLGSLLYCLLYIKSDILSQAIISCILSITLFLVLRLFSQTKNI